MHNRNLIVATMHRSGSSVIGQWLVKCGLHLGDEMFGPGVGNVEGHFEDIDFLTINENILRAHGLPHSGFTTLTVNEITAEEKHELNNLIARKNVANVEWGFKDPRTALLLKVYREEIPDAFYLFILRDYKYIVSSLLTRMYKDKDKQYNEKGLIGRTIWKIKKGFRKKYIFRKHATHFLAVWITYCEEMLKCMQQLPSEKFLVVDVSTVIVNDKKIIDHFNEQWNFQLTYFPFNKVYKEKLISKSEPIEPFIKNASLLEMAEALSAKLQTFLIK